MRHFNCFIKFVKSKKKYSMFIQIPEDVMNDIDPQTIKIYLEKEIGKRFLDGSAFVRITNITILGCYESKN